MWRPTHAPPRPPVGPRLPSSGGFDFHNFSLPPPGPPGPFRPPARDLGLRVGPPAPPGVGDGHNFRPSYPPPHILSVMPRGGPDGPPFRAPYDSTVAPPGFGGGGEPRPLRHGTPGVGGARPTPSPYESVAPPGAGCLQPAPSPGGPAAVPAGRLEPSAGQQSAPDTVVRGGGGGPARFAHESGGGDDSEGTATERWLAAWLGRSDVARRCSENAAKKNTIKAMNLSSLRALPAAELERPETAAHLRRLVAQRRRRREAERRRRQAERQRLQRRHAEIDAWLADIRQRAARQQEAEEVKREADIVLAEVRKKISDVEKHLETLEELRTLREVRDLKARTAGLFSSAASDQRFAEVTARLNELLDRHLVTYEAELRALQAMTAGPPPPLPPPPASGAAAAAGPLPVLRALFGPSGVSAAAAAAAAAAATAAGRKTEEPDHLVHMVDWEADPQTLLDIRSDWDRYLVGPDDPLGSAVPSTWVVPAPPSSDVWASYLAA